MNIQWYPGHMTKARRMMEESLKLIDIVIELIDARIPISSRNPDIDTMSRGKARLIILNKADLADEKITKTWLECFKSQNINAISIDSRKSGFTKQVSDAVLLSCKEKIERDKKRGIKNKPVRAMIVGIPNVGKSTFINTLCGRASAKTGNKPGVTKGKQWIKLTGSIELLDTPGILWPKFDDEKTGENIAFIGSVNDEIIDAEELCVRLISVLAEMAPGCIKKRYEASEDKMPYEVLQEIAIKRNCLKKGSEPDTLRAARLVLNEFKDGKLGRITLEAPEQ